MSIKKSIRKAVIWMLAAWMLIQPQGLVWADNEDAAKGTDSDTVVITDDDKPYISLGADLTDKERGKVLEYMGITQKDLTDYKVSYVSNKEEHKYLDDYIPAKEIGTRALSSVIIKETEKGKGVNVSTYNINFCTAGMYKNALATAGVENADLIVAGPFSISGTAALVGVMKAYEEMTGKKLDESAVDAAMNELVVTGAIESGDDKDSGKVEAMIADLKEKAADGEFDNEEDVRKAVTKAAKEYGVSLSADEIEKLTDFLTKLKGLDLDWSGIRDQAEKLGDVLGDKLKDVDSQSIWDKIAGFFGAIADAIRSIFKG